MSARNEHEPKVILMLTSNPDDTDRLRVGEEFGRIDDALRSSDQRDHFQLRYKPEMGARQLQTALFRHKPRIVHFSGHGDSRGRLLFTADDGLSAAVDQAALATVFEIAGKRAGLECVVLSACYSAAQARLIALHVKYVIGMVMEISDAAAKRFSPAFYEALGYEVPVEQAFRLGLATIDLSDLPGSQVPRLYVDGELFVVPGVPEDEPPEREELVVRSVPASARSEPARPAWASSAGQDHYGRWANFRVETVEQRMRWIEPGSFVMGSPEDEPGRFEIEGPQHQVTLTQGFWIADTPCTQALWEVVMGSNPSRFVSLRRPVEQVSWDDVQGFLGRLNASLPGLGVELPTEAQWEYACRAGTDTATYVGAMKILGENNAPVLDAIAWYGGNSGEGFELADGADSSGWPEKQYAHERAGSREVGLKHANAWGVYDMLGNVWEWCADRYGLYEAGAVEDPSGPASGPGRVDRGGSWLDRARVVRAASRNGSDPGDRFHWLGFRLVRGQ